jgi:hypothetical protein
MTMTSRRTFTFASLALAAAGTARAADLQAQSAAPPAAHRWKIERRSTEISVTLAFVNTAGRPVSILTKQGSRPGGEMQAALEVDGESIALAEVREHDRREMMSRMGPIPQFVDVAPGAEIALGPWRFSLPKGSKDEPVSLVAQLYVDGETVEVRSGVVAGERTSV